MELSGQGHNGAFDNGPHGGVMVHQDIPFKAMHLQMTLQVKTVKIGLTRPYTVASIYIPPHNLNVDDLEDLFGHLPRPFLLLGNFIGRHHFWGDTLCNPLRRTLESYF